MCVGKESPVSVGPCREMLLLSKYCTLRQRYLISCSRTSLGNAECCYLVILESVTQRTKALKVEFPHFNLCGLQLFIFSVCPQSSINFKGGYDLVLTEGDYGSLQDHVVVALSMPVL